MKEDRAKEIAQQIEIVAALSFLKSSPEDKMSLVELPLGALPGALNALSDMTGIERARAETSLVMYFLCLGADKYLEDNKHIATKLIKEARES